MLLLVKMVDFFRGLNMSVASVSAREKIVII